MAKGKNGEKPILIIKKKGGHHDGHHGGAWKVAYADFVTAMMAFFLLLWLLNVTTEEQRLAIANYFMPESVSTSNSGAGGVLGGLTVSPGQMTRQAGGLTMSIPVAPDASESEEAEDVDGEGKPPERNETSQPGRRVLADGSKDHDKQFDKQHDKQHDKQFDRQNEKDKDKDRDRQADLAAKEAMLREQLARQEEESFRKAEHDLKQAIQDIPELKQLAENLIVDRTPEGLRIQIVDQGRYSMFPLGSAQPMEHTRKLMGLVAKVVQKLPNRIAVTGHTDALQFQNTGNRNYGNWELSTDRANSSRRALMEAGLPRERVSRVVGKADQDPLFADNPTDPRNRRISIVLLRDNTTTAAN